MSHNLSPDGDIRNSTTLYTNYLHVSKACSFGLSSPDQRAVDTSNTIISVESILPYTLTTVSNISAITASVLSYNKLNNTITLQLDVSFTQSGGGPTVVFGGLPEQSASNTTTVLYATGAATPSLLAKTTVGSSNLTIYNLDGNNFINGNPYHIYGIISYQSTAF
jgi:hypothetical protein